MMEGHERDNDRRGSPHLPLLLIRSKSVDVIFAKDLRTRIPVHCKVFRASVIVGLQPSRERHQDSQKCRPDDGLSATTFTVSLFCENGSVLLFVLRPRPCSDESRGSCRDDGTLHHKRPKVAQDPTSDMLFASPQQVDPPTVLKSTALDPSSALSCTRVPFSPHAMPNSACVSREIPQDLSTKHIIDAQLLCQLSPSKVLFAISTAKEQSRRARQFSKSQCTSLPSTEEAVVSMTFFAVHVVDTSSSAAVTESLTDIGISQMKILGWKRVHSCSASFPPDLVCDKDCRLPAHAFPILRLSANLQEAHQSHSAASSDSWTREQGRVQSDAMHGCSIELGCTVGTATNPDASTRPILSIWMGIFDKSLLIEVLDFSGRMSTTFTPSFLVSSPVSSAVFIASCSTLLVGTLGGDLLSFDASKSLLFPAQSQLLDFGIAKLVRDLSCDTELPPAPVFAVTCLGNVFSLTPTKRTCDDTWAFSPNPRGPLLAGVQALAPLTLPSLDARWVVMVQDGPYFMRTIPPHASSAKGLYNSKGPHNRVSVLEKLALTSQGLSRALSTSTAKLETLQASLKLRNLIDQRGILRCWITPSAKFACANFEVVINIVSHHSAPLFFHKQLWSCTTQVSSTVDSSLVCTEHTALPGSLFPNEKFSFRVGIPSLGDLPGSLRVCLVCDPRSLLPGASSHRKEEEHDVHKPALSSRCARGSASRSCLHATDAMSGDHHLNSSSTCLFSTVLTAICFGMAASPTQFAWQGQQEHAHDHRSSRLQAYAELLPSMSSSALLPFLPQTMLPQFRLKRVELLTPNLLASPVLYRMKFQPHRSLVTAFGSACAQKSRGYDLSEDSFYHRAFLLLTLGDGSNAHEQRNRTIGEAIVTTTEHAPSTDEEEGGEEEEVDDDDDDEEDEEDSNRTHGQMRTVSRVAIVYADGDDVEAVGTGRATPEPQGAPVVRISCLSEDGSGKDSEGHGTNTLVVEVQGPFLAALSTFAGIQSAHCAHSDQRTGSSGVGLFRNVHEAEPHRHGITKASAELALLEEEILLGAQRRNTSTGDSNVEPALQGAKESELDSTRSLARLVVTALVARNSKGNK